MVAALPLALPFRGDLISQSPQRYTENPAVDAIPTKQGDPAHHSATKGTPDDSPADQYPDKDDDEEDLIPGDLLEGDSDSGGESDIGNDAVSVANGLLGSGGAGSAALNNQTSGSTAVFCSLFACASAAQSDGKVSTSASGATMTASGGPLVSVKGPLVVINVSRTSVRNNVERKGERAMKGYFEELGRNPTSDQNHCPCKTCCSQASQLGSLTRGGR